MFASGKKAVIGTAYAVSKGTLLQTGRHTWTVKYVTPPPHDPIATALIHYPSNIVCSMDVGVVAPSHASHFNCSTKTAWGIRDNGLAHYTPNTKQFEGFKTGGILHPSICLFSPPLLFENQ